MGSECFQIRNTFTRLGGGTPREGMEASHTPTPYLALCICSIWLFLPCILYNTPVIMSKALLWALWAILASYQTWEGDVGTPDLQPVGQKYRWQPGTYHWHPKWGEVLWIESLTCRVCWFQAVGARIEWNRRTPSWWSRELENCMVWRKPTPGARSLVAIETVFSFRFLFLKSFIPTYRRKLQYQGAKKGMTEGAH